MKLEVHRDQKPSAGPIVVLDHGEVEVIRISETDEAIVDYARVTTKEMEGIKHRPTRGLIRYLLQHSHTSPFEFPDVVLYVKAPLFVYNQWCRHRTSELGDGEYESTDSTARKYNTQQMFSGRYARYSNQFYIPSVAQLRTQSMIKMQGPTDEPVDQPGRVTELLVSATEVVDDTRNELITEHRLANQLARIITPFNQYVGWYWKQNLWNLLHWIRLRRTSEAQWEIKQYADIIEGVIADAFPLTYEEWINIIEGATLTVSDLQELLPALDGKVLSEPLARKLQGAKRVLQSNH